MNCRFASDNTAGVHPAVMQALNTANAGYATAYGEDAFSNSIADRVAALFSAEARAFFVYNGTAANVLGLAACLRMHEAVICTAMAHINVHECGAPERFTGAKLITVDAPDGKLNPAAIEKCLVGIGDEHMVQPRVVSLTQATEAGTVYTLEEIQAVAACAHSHDLLVHMDGARLANAAAALKTGLADITSAAGVDVFSVGGTKNGLMAAEALVFANPDLSPDFKYIRKQGMQLNSKMRYMAAQFEAYLDNDLWQANAEHANRMAALLADELTKLPDIKTAYPVQTNAVFVHIPPEALPAIRKGYFFHVWDEDACVVRLMCAFDIEEADIAAFVSTVKESLDRAG